MGFGNHRFNVVAVSLALVIGTLQWGCSGGVLGASRNDPRHVARGYIEALAAQDCEKARSHIAPGWDEVLQYICGPSATSILVSAKIDQVLVQQAPPNLANVDVLGEFVWTGVRAGTDHSYGMMLERWDGNWYLSMAW